MRATPRVHRLGALEVDLGGYRVSLAARALDLSTTQIELLGILIAHKDRVVSRSELSARLGLVRSRSVDVLLTSLRHVLGRDFLRNVRGRGWILDARALAE